MAVAGGAGLLLCASRRVRPQAPEADLLEHPDNRAGDRYFRHRRRGPSAKDHADSQRRRDLDPDAISPAALHLHDDERRDDGARDRGLPRARDPVAADPDVRVVGQLSRRLHRRTRRNRNRGRGHVRPGVVRRRRPHRGGVAARIDHAWMRGGHAYQSVRRRLVDWSRAFGRRPADSTSNRRLGAAVDDDAVELANLPE